MRGDLDAAAELYEQPAQHEMEGLHAYWSALEHTEEFPCTRAKSSDNIQYR